MKMHKNKAIYTCVLIILIVIIVIFTILYVRQKDKYRPHNAYQTTWGLLLPEETTELYYAESDHWFGEGDRYSILFSPNGLQWSQPADSDRKKTDKTQGSELLQTIYQNLSIEENYRLKTENLSWEIYEKSNGSKLLVSELGTGIYVIAEELL